MTRRPGSVRWVMAVIGLALAGITVSAGCGNPNAAATKACAKAANSTACHSCCGMHGSNTTTFAGSCTCY